MLQTLIFDPNSGLRTERLMFLGMYILRKQENTKMRVSAVPL